jgi:hypothetical protein
MARPPLKQSGSYISLLFCYFEYGHHGVIYVYGIIPASGLLAVESLATGERFYIVPVMLEGRRRVECDLEMLAIVAKATQENRSTQCQSSRLT